MSSHKLTIDQKPRLRRFAGGGIVAGIVALSVLAGAIPAHADAARDAQYWLSSYGITEAWKTTKGKGITIAVMDTGIGKGPKDFEGAVVGGTDVSGVGSPDGRTPVGAPDENPHGSWVASLAAGRGHGGTNGPIGVAPEASLLAISVGFPSSGTTVPFTDQVVEGIHWAVDNGANVINMSFTIGTTDWPESWDEAFQYAYDHDVVIVAAAGNRGSGSEMVGAPATVPGVLTVAGVDETGEASQGASTQGITIGVSAPSEKLTGVSPNGSVVEWAGTSGASPIVAGMVALVMAAHPELDANNVVERIVKTAVPSKFQDDVPGPLYGYGLANVNKAIHDDVPKVDVSPMGSLEDWVKQFRRAKTKEGEAPVDTSKVKALPPVSESNVQPNPLFPTYDTLRLVSIPLAMLLGTATLVVLGAVGATRHFRRVTRE